MKSFKCAMPGMILGFVLTSQNSFANPDFTKKTAKKCVYCHIGKWTSQQYTEAGQYFKDHNTLKGYVPKQQTPEQNPGAQSKGETSRNSVSKEQR